MEHDVGENSRLDVLQSTHRNHLYYTGKNAKGGHSAQGSVWKAVGRLGDESSILYLSGYLLNINFLLGLYFAASQNVEICELSMMSHENLKMT